MAEANALTIAALPADGHAWRIDWFGEIAFPNRMIRRKQPSVLLHLSRVINERYHEDHSVLLNPESTFVVKQRKVWVSVGTLAQEFHEQMQQLGNTLERLETQREATGLTKLKAFMSNQNLAHDIHRVFRSALALVGI